MAGNLDLLSPVSLVAVLFCVAFTLNCLATAQQVSVPTFISVNISLTNKTSTDRVTKVALTSSDESFELVLIQDGFGTDKGFQYCWTEVHDTATGTDLTWRAPCNPVKVDECSLILTSDGDFRLQVAANGANEFAFQSETGGQGVVHVQLTNQGDLLLVKADNSTVWRSSDHIQRQQKCKEAFNPSNSSSRLGSTSFVFLASTILVSLILSQFSF